MVLTQNFPKKVQNLDDWGIPQADSILVIRCKNTGQKITVLNGEVVLSKERDPPGSKWVLVKIDDWYGFRNQVSGRYLGRGKQDSLGWPLICDTKEHREWEKFRIVKRVNGDYTLLMTHWFKESPVGVRDNNGVSEMVMLENGDPEKFA